MRIRKEFLFIITLFTWSCIASQPIYQGKTTKTGETAVTEQTLYDSAVHYFRQKQYGESERLFDRIVAEHPKSDLAQKSAYMCGYLYTVTDNPNKNYSAAKERFGFFIRQYPNSRYRSDSQSWFGIITELDKAESGSASASCDSLAVKNKSLTEEIRRLNFIIEQLQAAQKKTE